MTKHSVRKRVESGADKGTIVKEPEPANVEAALKIYRKERWGRLKRKGYIFDVTKNRATYCGTIAVPEKGDPGYERPTLEDSKG